MRPGIRSPEVFVDINIYSVLILTRCRDHSAVGSDANGLLHLLSCNNMHYYAVVIAAITVSASAVPDVFVL